MNQSLEAAAAFQPLSTRRSSERVADVIRETILRGTFGPGDVLPPERTLATRFRVTRNTVRDALRQLEQLRLVTIRQGSGVHVQDYLSTTGLEFLAVLLRTAAAEGDGLLEDVLEARALLGGVIFGHAARHADPRGIATFVEAVDDFEQEAHRLSPDARALQELELELHSRLVRAGGNRAFILLYNSVRHVYARVADLFEGVVADPQALAAHYRRAASALEEDDREAAAKELRAVFSMGQPELESSKSKSKSKPRRARERRQR